MFWQKSVKAIESIQRPWDVDEHSLLKRIRAAPTGDDGVLELDLNEASGGELRWAAGALDALMGRSNDTPAGTSARRFVAALGNLLRRRTPDAFRHFYDLLEKNDAAGLADDVLERVGQSNLDRGDVARVARVLAAEAPNPNAVKFAIAMLGAAGEPQDESLILELGRCEDLTLFSAVALMNLLPDPEDALWSLAKGSYGWGRIQAVRRLQGVQRSDIGDWLLREGYRNAIMYEETAWVCAVSGGLLDALKTDSIDADLVDAAGDILEALVIGGPAEDISDYADGAKACVEYIRHVANFPADRLRRYLVVDCIRRYADEIEGEGRDGSAKGWTAETRWAIRTGAAAYLGQPQWRDLVQSGVGASDANEFSHARRVGDLLGVDTWPAVLARQQQNRDADEWYSLMQTDDRDRVEQVVALATEQLDLELVGSGPGLTLGLGREFADDSAMDFIVQDLRRFPGVGWPLVEIALRGRSVRLRHMAIRALDAWGRGAWPENARAAITRAHAVEPDNRVREGLSALLAESPVN